MTHRTALAGLGLLAAAIFPAHAAPVIAGNLSFSILDCAATPNNSCSQIVLTPVAGQNAVRIERADGAPVSAFFGGANSTVSLLMRVTGVGSFTFNQWFASLAAATGGSMGVTITDDQAAGFPGPSAIFLDAASPSGTVGFGRSVAAIFTTTDMNATRGSVFSVTQGLPPIAAVPAPGAIALFGLAFAGLLAARRRA